MAGTDDEPLNRTHDSVPFGQLRNLAERNSSFKCYTMEMDAPSETTPARSTRQAQTAANDLRIIEAARAVLLADPDAPISAIAERAGVGIAALYRRYPSKEELIRQIYHENQQVLLAMVRAALADDGDPWDVLLSLLPPRPRRRRRFVLTSFSRRLLLHR